MSLESKIEELNGNIVRLIDAIGNMGAASPAKAEKATKPKAEKPAPKAEEPAQSDDASEETGEVVQFSQVTDAVKALAKKDRDAAKAILEELGVARATELSEDQYATALAKFNAALEE